MPPHPKKRSRPSSPSDDEDFEIVGPKQQSDAVHVSCEHEELEWTIHIDDLHAFVYATPQKHIDYILGESSDGATFTFQIHPKGGAKKEKRR